jgi:Phage integrase family
MRQASTAVHWLGVELALPPAGRAKEGTFVVAGNPSGTNVLIEEGFELVVRRHFVALATFFVEADPPKARLLIESIDTSTIIGLCDRVLIGVMTYAFARIGAVVSMRVEDYFANGKRWWVRLHEKGGKRHEMPAHHKLEAFLDEYLRTAGIAGDEKNPLFRSAVRRTGTLAATAMHRVDAYRMIQRRAADLGMKVKIGCHTFRATRITAYLEAGGTLENAQAMAAHESPRTPDRQETPSDAPAPQRRARTLIAPAARPLYGSIRAWSARRPALAFSPRVCDAFGLSGMRFIKELDQHRVVDIAG